MHTRDNTEALPQPRRQGRPAALRLPWAVPDERTLVLAAIGVVTALAFLLRLIAAQQTLFGDELFTYSQVKYYSLGAVVSDFDTSPPLYNVLAWLFGHIGDPTKWIRAPSVIAGAATVPVLYLLGDAIGGRRSGLIAAALFAVSPWAVYYGSEARPYAMLMFFTALSTLSMLRALGAKEGDPARLRWWGVFVAASALGLYTHYVAGIVLALQASWALITQSGRRKEIFVANAIALLIFLPWYPRVNNDSGALLIYQFTDPLTLSNILGDLPSLSIGSAYTSLAQVPGRFSEVLIILAVATIVVELVRRAVLPRVGWFSATHRGAAAPEPPKLAGSVKVPWAAWLPPLLAVGIPTVTVLYSLKADISIYEIRHIMTLIPYLCVVVGVATALLSRRVAWAVGSVLVVALLIGSVRELSKYPRLDLQGAAQVINKTAPQGSVVVEPLRPGHLAPVNEPDPLQQGLPIYLDHRFLPIKHPDDASEWPKGRDVYLVQGSLFLGGGLQFAALSAGAQPVQSYDLDGWQTVNVTHYAPVGTAKPPNPAKEQERAIGNYIATHPEAFQEYLQQHPDANRRFQQALQKRLGAP